jgi:hypothetical protein
MSPIELATVLPGAVPFKEGNVNDTFRGQVLLSDQTVRGAVLKDLDAKQLANELLTAVLAREAGLPTPKPYFALVRGSDLPVSKAPSLADGNRVVFASVDVKIPNVTFRATGATPDQVNQLIEDILEWAGLGELYGFDAWVANVDRHPGNLLFGGKEQVWLIDHGHCFSGPDWQPEDLVPDGNYRNRLAEWLTARMNLEQKRKRSSEAVGFAASVASIDIAASSTNSHIRGFLPAEHVAAMEGFLRQRSSRVPRHASKALGVPVLV